MKTILMTLFFILTLTSAAETFKSQEIVQNVRKSADIKTQTIYWWNGWTTILPKDGTDIDIKIKKNVITIEGKGTYTLESMSRTKNKHSCCKAVDQQGKKWLITICRDKRIYAIQLENEKIMLVYQ